TRVPRHKQPVRRLPGVAAAFRLFRHTRLAQSIFPSREYIGLPCGRRYLTFWMRKFGSLARTNSVALLAASKLPASAFDAAATSDAMKLSDCSSIALFA